LQEGKAIRKGKKMKKQRRKKGGGRDEGIEG
jgi:hypothetical protein